MVVEISEARFNIVDYVFLGILFCIALFIFSLPFQNDPRPFGEGDAAWHFANGDYMSSRDRSMDLQELPLYIGYWYYHYNPILGPQALQYPPPPDLLYSISQIVGGDRFVTVRIVMALGVFLGAFSVYFLLKKLYSNSIIAFLSSLCLIFSVRSHLPYLFGQQATFTSIIFFPLIIYCTYKFIDSLYTEDNQYIYLYILVLLLVSQFMFHLIGLIPSFIFIILYVIYSLIRNRKIPLTKKLLLHISIITILALILILPFIKIYAGAFAAEAGSIKPKFEMGRLFTFSIGEKESAFPYADFFAIYPTGFALFLILGLVFTLFRRSHSDCIIFIWLITIYLFFHADFIGVDTGRISRVLELESQIFYPIAFIGAFGIISLFKIGKGQKKVLAYSLAIVLVILTVALLGTKSYNSLKDAYPGLSRLNLDQLNACENIMKSDIPKDSIVLTTGGYPPQYLGTISYAKVRWLLAVCQRFVQPIKDFDHIEKFYLSKGFDTNTVDKYIMFDYSDLLLLNQQQWVLQLEKLESNYKNNSLVFNQYGIKVYKT